MVRILIILSVFFVFVPAKVGNSYPLNVDDGKQISEIFLIGRLFSNLDLENSFSRPNHSREVYRMYLLIKYALSFLGMPYLWGGDDPSGWDCSGMVQEILAAAGEDPPGDQTSQGLFYHFDKHGIRIPNVPNLRNNEVSGALSFYGKNVNKITHVGFIINSTFMIEAGGGGSRVKTYEDAVKYNAFVRLRRFRFRKDLVAIIKPRYSKINSFYY